MGVWWVRFPHAPANVCLGKNRRLELFDLIELEFDGRVAAEDVDEHL